MKKSTCYGLAILIGIGIRTATLKKCEVSPYDYTKDVLANVAEEYSVGDFDTFTSLGLFRISYYCGCAECNEKYGNVDCKGLPLSEGAVAAGPSIPYGSKLYINTDGVMNEYVVRDRGGKITDNCIDIYVTDHNVAKQLGIIYTDVFVKN